MTLVSVCFIACGKDESGGSDDDDDTPTVTTTTATTSPTTNTTSPTTNTTNPNTSSTTGTPTTTTGSSSGSGGMGGSGGTTGVGGSAGEQGNVGGSAGAPGGSGGSTVVIEDDCGYAACGGDLADTEWSYSRVCVERDALLAVLQSVCEDVELISSSGEVSGTIGFGTDTYDQDASLSITGEFQVPAACNPLGCALTQAALGTVGGFSDPSCTDSAGGGCVCSGTLATTSEVSEGDYAIDGDNLTLDETEGTYCASGDSFKYTGELQGVEFVYETVPQ